MASTIVRTEKEEIMKELQKEEVKTVVLFGDTGVGKTWLAREISESAIIEDLFYGPLWVYVNPRDEKWSGQFEDSIAYQLSVLSTVEELEEDGVSKEDKRDDQQKPDDLREKISKKLEEMRSETINKDKHLLLILDGVTDKMNEDVIMKELKALLHLTDQSLFKVLITQRKEPVEDKTDGKKNEENESLPEPDSSTLLQPKEGGTDGEKKKETTSEPLSELDSLNLLQPKEGGTDGEKKGEIEERTEGKKEEEIKRLSEPDSSTLLPQKEERTDGKKKEEIISLSQSDSSTLLQQKQERTDGKMEVKIERLSEADSLTLLKGNVTKNVSDLEHFKALSQEIAKRAEGLPAAIVVIAGALNSIAKYDSEVWTLEGAVEEAAACEKVNNDPNPLLRLGYDMLLSCSNMAFINCFSHSRKLVLKHGAIHYNELIAYWILEGYVGSADHIEKAYEEGHCILMELIDCGMLKIEEDKVANMEGWALTFPDCRHDGYERASSLGLASVFDNGRLPSLGKIAPGIGMIKTLCNRQNLHKVSTLLIDGSHLCREAPETFLLLMKGLQNLAIFNPRIKSWPSWLSGMDKLHLLVLRGCDQLREIDDIKIPESLQVLEISGATSLKVIPDVFPKLLKLLSLNLSAIQIESLPSSFSNLGELRWLILRDCSCLEKLPKIKDFKNLEVLDLSGATSLKEFEDKNFEVLQGLQKLDFSNTKIKRLPFLKKLEKLTQLYLSGCKHLTRLPSLASLSALQILDLSGAIELKEIHDNSLQKKDDLKILNLSNIAIGHLPSNISNLPNLELLDLSDASNLVEIQDNIFEQMKCLRCLKLSNAKIKRLPSLSNLGNLRQLLLQGCSALTVTGDESIQPSEKIEAKFLEPMVQLQFLNLSGTRLKLPPISMLTNLTNLCQLSLGGCSLSESNLNLEKYSKLEVLDLSNTNISSLPSLNSLSNLRELKLRDCSSLRESQHLNSLIHLEVLDLRGTGIKEYLNEISELTHLKQLDLPDMEGIQKLEWGMITHLPEELNWAQCVEFKHDEDMPSIVDKGKVGGIYWHRGDKKFREIYFKTRSIPEKHDRYLEIIGYDSFPDAVKDAILQAEYISLVDNNTINSLSKLSAGKTEAILKGCWLERCTAMESLFGGEESQEKEVRSTETEHLEILWASNLPNLKSVYKGETHREIFKSLKQLYLDCCPMLKVVFPTSHMAENLEFLQIKFCDKLKVLFESVDCTLHKLRTLHLECCPTLEVVFPTPHLAENLEILQIKCCDKLKVLSESVDCTLQKLHTLHLVELPELTSIEVLELKSIFTSPNSIEIKIRECPQLENLGEIQEFGGSVENSKNKSIEIE